MKVAEKLQALLYKKKHLCYDKILSQHVRIQMDAQRQQHVQSVGAQRARRRTLQAVQPAWI